LFHALPIWTHLHWGIVGRREERRGEGGRGEEEEEESGEEEEKGEGNTW